MISYCGLPLYFPDAGLAAHVASAYAPQDILEWPIDVPRNGVRPSGVQLPDKLVLGRLRWPRDASRFATFHALVDTAGLKAVRAAVYNPYRTGLLVLDDGTFKVQTQMWMLPPRPLRQEADNKNEPWLLSLVDDRFFWWVRAADIQVTDGVTTWADLYAAVATGLGVTILADSIPSAYLTPPAAFSASYEYLPPLLDAIAMNVGQRIVRGLDGKVKALNAASSRSVVANNLAQRWQTAAGGQMGISWT